MKTALPFVCALCAGLGGCASMGLETPAAPRALAPDPGVACAPEEPEGSPLAEGIARWRQRVNLCAGRVCGGLGHVRNDLGRLEDEAQSYLEMAIDSDVTKCLLLPVGVAAFVVAVCTGHGGAINLGSCAAPSPP